MFSATFLECLNHTFVKHPELLSACRKLIEDLDQKQNPNSTQEKLISTLQQQINNQRSPAYAFLVYSDVMCALKSKGGNCRSVLELGPGATLGSLFCFLAFGAGRAVGIDISPIQKDAYYFQILKKYLSCVTSFGWDRPRNPQLEYDKSWQDVDEQQLAERIEYFSPVNAAKLPFSDGEFDLVYSNAVLEHFEQPREAIEESFRVLMPGGTAVHFIDLQSHNSKGELSLFRLSEAEHKQMSQCYDPEHGLRNILAGDWKDQVFCNRLLAHEWKQLFTGAGFDVLNFKIMLKLNSQLITPSEFAYPFNQRTPEELAPLGLSVTVRRPT
ncbi:MAG: methyltransferase domain-containing protein [Desulfuromonadaceae bacterium]